MELIKEQLFEVNNDLRIGHLRGIYEDKKLNCQWIPTNIGKDKSAKELKVIQKIVNEITKKFSKFEKILNICDEHYGKEVDYICDGLNHHVDLFTIEEVYDVWVRLIPQKGEYNLYIYVYEKSFKCSKCNCTQGKVIDEYMETAKHHVTEIQCCNCNNVESVTKEV